MIGKRKALMQLMIVGTLGGWLAGACINASEGILAGLIHINAFKGMSVGLVSCVLLMFPWSLSLRQKGWWASGVLFGVLASVLAVTGYFLIWPYEAHGRSAVHKTVLAVVASYPIPVFGIGGLLGLGASTWIRPSLPQDRIWSVFVIPCIVVLGLSGIVWSMQKEEEAPVRADIQTLECCFVAYQAFVKKVGVSYAIFEAEKYCQEQLGPQAKCTAVEDCLDSCAHVRKACPEENKACKDAYRKCVLACPPPPEE